MATPYHIKVPWARKPPPGTPIDSTNFFVQRSIAVYAFNDGPVVRDLTANTTASWVADTAAGEGIRVNKSMGYTMSVSADGFLAEPITVQSGTAPVYQDPAAGNGGAFFWHGQVDAVHGQEHRRLLVFNSATDGIGIKDTTYYPFFWPGSDHGIADTGITLGVPQTMMGYHRHQEQYYWWVNGEPAGSGDPGDNRYMDGILEQIGGRNGNGGIDGEHSLLILFEEGYIPTDVQAKSLHENPWQIFEPQTIPIYVPAAAASTTYYSIKVPWTRQPPDGIKLDMSNPLLRDCTVHFPFRHVVEASAAFCERNTTERNSAELLYDLNVNNSVSLVGTDRGQALELIKTDDGSSDYLYCNKQSTFSGGGSDAANYSFSVWFRCRTDQTGKNMFVFESYSSGSNSGPNLRIYGDDLLDCVVYLTTGFLVAGDVTNVVDDKWHHVVGTWDTRLATNEFKLYLDGVLNDTKTSSYDAANQTTTWQWFALGNGSTMGGKIQEFMWWHERVLTAAEVKSLYDNQWQIYQPQTLPIYVPAAAPPAAARRFLTLLGVS